MFKDMFYRMLDGSNLFDVYAQRMRETQKIAQQNASTATDTAVNAAVARLSMREQEYLALHLEGVHYENIARIKGVTYQIALKTLASAYSKLRIELNAFLH